MINRISPEVCYRTIHNYCHQSLSNHTHYDFTESHLRSAIGQSTSFLSSPSRPSLQTITRLRPAILFIDHFQFCSTTFSFLDHFHFLRSPSLPSLQTITRLRPAILSLDHRYFSWPRSLFSTTFFCSEILIQCASSISTFLHFHFS